ncbi:ribosomal protein S12 methylthiotransferase accessory factor [Lentzea xinjiangensis]|uniref:Ribosomal protein S12 methylthiotransferase accessory factor n=1 Tax=Lentzea xinjiangensis TaxID=402600 RepID=A0A1H9HUR5_9PSEU|nr:TOMM precursor leader peptide-binding protein [Lentzea xinjiangensis]SEQ66005.1 ribosomal protein S12 methylthiotransferase accessory factor [Lentzea xinjiangensis]
MRPELAEPDAHRIGFRRHLRPQIVRGEAVYLIGESGVTAIQGPHVESLAPLLDGTRDLAALLRDLPAGLTADVVGRMLTRLAAAGLIGRRGEDEDCSAEATLAYWDAAGLDPADAVTATTTSLVSVVTIGDIDREALVDALHRNELTVTSGNGDLTVVACADYLASELRDIDDAHRAAGKPWLLVKPVGAEVSVGPFFTPGDGPCWRCLAARLSANRKAEAHVRRRCGQRGPAPRPLIGLPSLTAMALEIASVETAKWLAGIRQDTQRSIWSYDSLTMQVTQHDVRVRPQCSGCGDPGIVARRAFEPVELTSRAKHSCDGGGHRSSPPQEVLDTYRHLIGPVTGIVKEIRRDDNGPEFFNSFRSGSNIAAGDGIEGLRSALRADTGGKGVTALDAQVGALCEAVERRSGSFVGDEAVVRGSYRSLGERAIHPDTVQHYHPRQFTGREAWNAAHSSFQHVTAPFDDDEVMDWTPLWSFTEQRHKLLPTGMLYFGAPCPPSVTSNSNGCAAGSSLEDAVLQGLLELVERDAVAIWWYNRIPMPGVDLDSFQDPWISKNDEVHASLGREVWLLDVTADLGVPVMVAVSRRTDGGPREDVVLGCGAHLDPRIAARRALTELNQCMPMVCGSADPRTLDVDVRRWFEDTKVSDHPWLRPDPTRPARDVLHHGYTHRGDLVDDIRSIQHTLEARGMELLALDQTRPDFGLPVVRVVVPGLRHFWSRFAQGRLYDVPVQLGLLSRPHRYDELNPIPLFM